MYLFVLGKNGWWLKLSSKTEIMEYKRLTEEPSLSKAIKSYTQNSHCGHQTDELGSNTSVLAHASGTSFYDRLIDLSVRRYMGMLDIFNEYGDVFVNSKGGYTSNLAYSKEVFLAEYRYPSFTESDIRVKKWECGQHFYAYIGDIQVKDRDIVKWSTEQEAVLQARKYLVEYNGG